MKGTNKLKKKANGNLICMFWLSEVFVNQKRINVCELTVTLHHMTVSNESHWGRNRKKGMEVNIGVVSKGQNELIGKFKMAAGDVIMLEDGLWSTSTFQQKLKEGL